MAYTLHKVAYTLSPAAFTFSTAAYTLSTAIYTLSPVAYTLSTMVYTLSPTAYTLSPTAYTLYCGLHTPPSLYITHWTLKQTHSDFYVHIGKYFFIFHLTFFSIVTIYMIKIKIQFNP